MINAFTMNNVLLTRKCNLSCEYCRIVKDYDDSPYGSVHNINETFFHNWILFGKWIKEHTDGFIILYGGEPLIYPNIEDILESYNNMGVSYTVITNAVLKNKALDLVKRGILKSLSCSVDPTIYTDKEKSDRLLKSNRGLQLLIEAKKINPDLDATAEIVVDKENYKHLKHLVEYLSVNKIWADITIIESPLNKWYDFAEDCDELLLNKDQALELKDIISDMVQSGKYLIHTPEHILYILEHGTIVKCDLDKCYSTTTIDSDGSIRLCLRIRGFETPKHNIFEYIKQGMTPKDVDDRIRSSIVNDVVDLCNGCSWTCVHMSKSHLHDIKHIGA